MKKRMNRRGLFVFLLVTFSYSLIVFDLPKRVVIKRERVHGEALFQGIGGKELSDSKEKMRADDLALSFPAAVVLQAIKDGQIEADSLILSKSGAKISWKKPLEIIREKDREGLKSLSRMIGRTYLVELLEKEGIEVSDDLDLETILLRSDILEESKLANFCRKYLPEKDLVFSGTKGDKLEEGEAQWVMPDLRGYPMREAVRVLNSHTSRIRVIGMGAVIDQEPAPKEKLVGEVECILRGNIN